MEAIKQKVYQYKESLLSIWKRVRSRKPLLVLSWDWEIFWVSMYTRKEREELKQNKGANAFQGAFVASRHDGLGKRTDLLRVDMLIFDQDADDPEAWAGVLAAIPEKHRDRATKGGDGVLRSYKVRAGETPVQMLCRLADETPGHLAAIQALAPTDKYSCTIVAAPGQQSADVLKVINHHIATVEAHSGDKVFSITSTNTGTPKDLRFPYAGSCDPASLADSLAGVDLKCGYDVLQKVAPLICDRHVALSDIIKAAFPQIPSKSIQVEYMGLLKAIGPDIGQVLTMLFDPAASSTAFSEHALTNPVLVHLRKTHTTPAALRAYFLENPAAFNTILHNARPDAIEIQDIIGFLYVLDNRLVEHFADGMDTGSEDGRG